MRKAHVFQIVIVLVALILSIYFYYVLPDRIPSHWNIEGNVDAYSGKLVGLFLIPIIMVFLILVFALIPKIDPLKRNINQFRKYLDELIIVILLFLLILHFQIILWSKGVEIPLNWTFPVAMGALFFYLGLLTEHSKRNWFLGIRTPWTLSSDKVWDKTNKFGGKLFKISGGIALIGIFLPTYFFYLIIIPVIAASIVSVVYSYIIYKKIRK